MKRRSIIIIIAVLFTAATFVVVLYRDLIFLGNEPATEVFVSESKGEVSADDQTSDIVTDKENPAFCEPDETIPDTAPDKVLDTSETALYSENILELSLGKDSIPPIENPLYTTIKEADLYFEDWDRMFVYEAAKGVYVYPQRIMVWHEIVNETMDGLPISITYCPLTSSTIVYTGDNDFYADNTYGTSGNLLNSNLVMYDRNTDSRIPQILGIGVTGDLNGIRLNTQPIHWAQWSDVKNTYDEAFVLSTETGFNRDYNRDPYGSYLPYDKWSYYQIGEPKFPLMNENDETFAATKLVIGVKSEHNVIALDPALVELQGVVHFTLGGQKAVAIFDSELKTVRVFKAQAQDVELTLTIKDGKLTDQNDIVWSEKGVSEADESLEPLTYFDVFWFAWYAYYPDTEVIA